MYNDNKYFYCTRRRIIKIFLLYKKTYNDNKYFYYTKRRITTINIFIIQKDV